MTVSPRIAGVLAVVFAVANVPQSVCSVSRAALLTGCYDNCVGVLRSLGPVIKSELACG
jgi:hypothetical protein